MWYDYSSTRYKKSVVDFIAIYEILNKFIFNKYIPTIQYYVAKIELKIISVQGSFVHSGETWNE